MGKRSEENGGGAREEVMSAGTVTQMRHVSKNPQTRRIGTRAGPSSCFQQKQAAALSRRSGRYKKKMVMATRMSRKRGEVKVLSSAPESSTRVSEGAQAGSQYFQDDKRPVVLFDGVCNLCNGGVNFVLDWDVTGKLRLAALQSEAGKLLLERSGRRPDDISSIVLVEQNEAFTKSEAVLKIAEYLSVPFPLLAQFFFPLPLLIRDTVYDQVATNRYSFFGKTAECRLSDKRFDDRFIE